MGIIKTTTAFISNGHNEYTMRDGNVYRDGEIMFYGSELSEFLEWLNGERGSDALAYDEPCKYDFEAMNFNVRKARKGLYFEALTWRLHPLGGVWWCNASEEECQAELEKMVAEYDRVYGKENNNA